MDEGQKFTNSTIGARLDMLYALRAWRDAKTATEIAAAERMRDEAIAKAERAE